jgi:ribosomal protein S18 acetylase RimI-like enzyme
MQDVTIRPVAIGDIEGVCACVGAVALEGIYLATTEPFRLADSASYIARLVEQRLPNAVALADGGIVGWCDIVPKHGPVYAHVGVLGMGLLPAFRGRGLGRRLIDLSLAAARRRFEQVELAVYATNLRAQALYRNVGFVERGRLPRGRKAGDRYDDVILMSLIFESQP